MLKKNHYIILIASVLIACVVAFLFFYLYKNVLNEMPDTDEEAVKASMYEYIKQYDNRSLKEISFKVTPNNNFAGVPGEHILCLETEEGFKVNVYASNDALDDMGTDYKYIYFENRFSNDMKERTGYAMMDSISSSLPQKETDYGSKNIQVSVDFWDVYEVIEEKNLDDNMTYQQYFNEDYKDIMKNIMFVLYYNFDGKQKDLKNVSEKEKNNYYEVYKKIFSNTEDLLPVDSYISIPDDKKENEYIHIAMFNIDDENNHTLLTKEEFMDRFEHPSEYITN